MRIKRLLSLFLILTILGLCVPAQNLTASAAEGQWMFPVASPYTINGTYGGTHYGIDIGASSDVPVYASKLGTVVRAYSGCVNRDALRTGVPCQGKCSPSSGNFWNNTCNWGYGNGLIIDHGDGTFSQYAHMASITVSNGQWVNQGQHVGYMGSSGNSTGRHLHFALAWSTGSKDTFNNNVGVISEL